MLKIHYQYCFLCNFLKNNKIQEKIVNKIKSLDNKAEFDKVDALINEITNSGEGKARRHINDEVSFYLDQRKRWEAHF